MNIFSPSYTPPIHTYHLLPLYLTLKSTFTTKYYWLLANNAKVSIEYYSLEKICKRYIERKYVVKYRLSFFRLTYSLCTLYDSNWTLHCISNWNHQVSLTPSAKNNAEIWETKTHWWVQSLERKSILSSAFPISILHSAIRSHFIYKMFKYTSHWMRKINSD